MQLARHGIFKNHGLKSLFREGDRQRIQYAQRNAGPRIVISVTATRHTESSYQYELEFTPEEIMRCILTLPTTSIRDAVRRLAPHFSLEAMIPEIVGQLTAGAIAAPRPPSAGKDDEELEEDDEREDA